jgi:SEC-C motif
LSEDAVRRISAGIDVISKKARKDGKSHDITFPLGEADSGVTVHCNDEPISLASSRLQRHCLMRKYRQKVSSWFGICLSPSDSSVRFGFKLDYVWKLDPKLEELSKTMPSAENFANRVPFWGRQDQVGRNELCPCGSGKKYKKCHL